MPVRSRNWPARRPARAWMTRPTAARAPLPACHLLVRCSGAVLRRHDGRTLGERMRTTIPRKPLTTLPPCPPFRACLLTPLADLTFRPWVKVLLLHPMVPPLVLLRLTLPSRRNPLVQMHLRLTSLLLGRWTWTRTMTMRSRRKRRALRPRAVPMAVLQVMPPMATELPVTAVLARPPRPSLLREKKTSGSVCDPPSPWRYLATILPCVLSTFILFSIASCTV